MKYLHLIALRVRVQRLAMRRDRMQRIMVREKTLSAFADYARASTALNAARVALRGAA